MNLLRSIFRAREEINMIPLLVGKGCDRFGVGEGEGLEEEDGDGGGEDVFGVLAFLLAIVSSEACNLIFFLVICINILSYSLVELSFIC